MENNELNKKIIKKVRNRVVISNLESEENMKLNRKKQVLSLVTVMLIIFAGGFITVNAATNGELAEKVKDTIKVVIVKEDGKEEELKGNTYMDSNNHTIEKYEIDDNGTSFGLEIDKTNLNGENMEIEGSIKLNDNESSIVIKGKDK